MLELLTGVYLFAVTVSLMTQDWPSVAVLIVGGFGAWMLTGEDSGGV